MVVNRSARGVEGDLTYGSVVAGVCTIDVAGQAAAQQGVVKSCVEFGPALFSSAFDADASKVGFPFLGTAFESLVEIQIGRLCL